MAEKVKIRKRKILFTGPNEAKFKMGNKMDKIVREAIKKYGKENVSIVSGGNPESIVDKNIEKYAKFRNLPLIKDVIDRKVKDAGAKRKKARKVDPDLDHYSFDQKGNLTEFDKHQDWAREKYDRVGKEIKKGRAKNVYGSNTRKVNAFLDELEDEPDLSKVRSGIKLLEKKSAYSEKNSGFPIIAGKNIDRVERLREEKRVDSLKPGVEEYKTIDDFEQKTYIRTDRDELNQAGKSAITRVKKGTKSPFSGKNISGKALSKTTKVKKATLLTTKIKPVKAVKSFKVKSYGKGNNKELVKDFTVKEIKKVISGTNKPPPPKFKDGPQTFPTTSSITQFEDPTFNIPQEHKLEAKKAFIAYEGFEEKKETYSRDKGTFLQSKEKQMKKELSDIKDIIVSSNKSLRRKNRRILKQGGKKFVSKKSLERIEGSIPDILSQDKQSGTIDEYKVPKIKSFGQNKESIQQGIRKQIKEGPTFTKGFKKSEYEASKQTARKNPKLVRKRNLEIANRVLQIKKRKAPVINPTKIIKGLAPVAIGAGMQGFTGEAYGEKAYRDVERGNIQKGGSGGGKRIDFLKNKLRQPLTRVMRKRYRNV